jgi:cytochrome oxidase Cu insertion factor (SCO1/SenC/PrrC family)
MQRLVQKTVVVLGSLVVGFAVAGPAWAQGPAEKTAEAAIVKVGETAPDFALPASDGKTYRLADLRGSKPLVLVIFRGVW